MGRDFDADPHLWRAVDHEGEVLESFVTKTRDKAAALNFIKKVTCPPFLIQP
jgi:transposase-like protein